MTTQGWAACLDPDERILWQGAPDQRLFLLRRADFILIPFGLFWGAGGVLWNIGAAMADAPFSFHLSSLPMLAIGFYLLIGRFMLDAYIRRCTFYALSTKRAFIATQVWGRKLRDITITPRLDTCVEHRRRLGTIIFVDPPKPRRGSTLRRTDLGLGDGNGGFVFSNITNADDVYDIVVNIQHGKQA
jgi:hypothetical protein